MLSRRENYLAAINHEKTDFVPDMMSDVIMVGGAFETFENGAIGGGIDDFGLEWICTATANGQAVPAPGCIPVPDVTEWKKYLKIPDLANYDWEEMARIQFGDQDRNEKAVVYGCWNSIFLRFSHLLGFEEALMAMYEEPEACYDMMKAIADYKCDLASQVAKYFKPDILTSYDDVCTERGPFMSPAAYRELVKPLHKQVNDTIRDLGMLPGRHCCGKCEDLIPDFIDEGAVCWESAQPINDINKILDTNGDRIAVAGGYDSNGVPARPDVTEEEIEQEVIRVLKTYGTNSSFILMGLLISNDPDPAAFWTNCARISKYAEKYRYDIQSL